MNEPANCDRGTALKSQSRLKLVLGRQKRYPECRDAVDDAGYYTALSKVPPRLRVARCGMPTPSSACRAPR